jgi:DNA-binding response OmpR family regulator
MKILVIDDDETVHETVGTMLERENFRPFLAGDGQSGFQKAISVDPELILIDLRLPGMSGADVCRKLRADGIYTPIIVISAVSDEIDKVVLLESGADDYIVKPFGARELIARIRAVLRRNKAETPRSITFSDVEVDVHRRVVTRGRSEVKLTSGEYSLLMFFLQNAGRALSRDLILDSVWGSDCYPNSRTVDAHVVHLRQKLEADPANPRHFVTMHGVGYRFQFD